MSTALDGKLEQISCLVGAIYSASQVMISRTRSMSAWRRSGSATRRTPTTRIAIPISAIDGSIAPTSRVDICIAIKIIGRVSLSDSGAHPHPRPARLHRTDRCPQAALGGQSLAAVEADPCRLCHRQDCRYSGQSRPEGARHLRLVIRILDAPQQLKAI